MKQCPACAEKMIPDKFTMCQPCETKYGKNRQEWPEWLQFLVQDLDREAKSELRRDGVEFQYGLSPDDLIPLDDSDITVSDEIVYDPWSNVDNDIDTKIATIALLEKLTPREREVLLLLLEGYNDEDIAKKLKIHQPNVSYFHKRIREKAKEMGMGL